MEAKSKTKVMKPAKEGELQHKVSVSKDVKKYKQSSIFEGMRKDIAVKREQNVKKAKAGLMTQNKIDRILQTGVWAG